MVAGTRSVTSRPVILPEERLAARPDHERAAEVGQLVQPAQQLEVVLDRLAEADARVELDPLLLDARPRPRPPSARSGTP